jgi:hypothetical protein
MTTARSELVDVAVTRWYHCISRCVRAASLIGLGGDDRKQWIERRLKLLAENFAIGVGGFAIMDNHLHVLCRLDPDEALRWSDDEVARRWLAVYPPRSMAIDDPEVVEAWVAEQLKDAARVGRWRQRLGNLGWFMKALKEPLSRLANKQDGCRGAFWDARYRSIAILDEEALLATCAYIDLNPLAAGAASTPESSRYTSLGQRLQHARRRKRLRGLRAATAGSVPGSQAAGAFEQDHWLVPLEDRRGPGYGSSRAGRSIREGMLESFSLGSYLLLVDYTSRLHRSGKARLRSEVAEIFQRLGTSGEFWTARLGAMLKSRDLRGSYFAADRMRVRTLASERGKRLANLTPQLKPLPRA